MKTSTPAFGGSPRERSATERPANFAASAMSVPRSGWRGAIIVSSDGFFARNRRWAAMMYFSSSACVEAAAITARSPIWDFRACRAERSAGGGGMSSLRLPVLLTCGAPSVAKRCASALDCARQRSKRCSSARYRVRQKAPAAERALRHPAVDQDHRDRAVAARQDQIGPQIGFDEQCKVGPPMIEEAADKSRRVERKKLMQCAGGQALLGERCRGNGA